MGTFSFGSLALAAVAGILPPLIWLYFLLKEDKRCPEPPLLIFIAFMAGMLAVPLVIPLESYVAHALPDGLPIIISWAAIEETMKYAACAIFVLWRRDVDESLDLVIYMLTTALGFAALENTLFLVTPFAQGDLMNGIVTDNLRFVGSTLLHVMASSVVGFTLAFTYRKATSVSGYALRATAVAFGLILAIALHSVFNFFIINASGSETVLAFFVVWTSAVIFFALFEILKYYRYRNLPTNTC